MTTGYVAPTLDPIVRLMVRNDGGKQIDIEAVVDTRFDSYLSLPQAVIDELGLQPFQQVLTRLATGLIVESPIYLVRVIWHDQELIIYAQIGEPDALIGMQLMLGSKVILHVRNGGPVEIEPEP